MTRIILFCTAALLLTACASFNPQPRESIGFEGRAVTLTRDELTVSAVALNADEAKAMFGMQMLERGIQPVWLRVENARSDSVAQLPLFFDRLYYTPAEAAFIQHGWFDADLNAAIDKKFHDNALPIEVAAGATVEGFLFGRPDLGTKALFILYAGDRTSIEMRFVVPVPGLDAKPFDPEALYPAGTVRDITDTDELRREIEALPCCVTDASGETEADPLNFVLIAEEELALTAMIAGGWDETETVTSGAALRTAGSFVFGHAYRYSPVSPLYVFGRPQDAAFQIIRDDIDERNHLRVWLTPLTYRGRPVWIGAISRDIGVIRSGLGTTHKIDPHVDDERWYLAQSLLRAQSLEAFAYAGGAPVSTRDNPRASLHPRNIFYSDGKRIVMALSSDPVGLDEIEYIEWDEPDPVSGTQ